MQQEPPTNWIRVTAGLLIALLALIALAGAIGLVLCLDTNHGRSPIEQTRTDAQTIRSAVELYLAENPGGRCPDVSDLIMDHMLNGNINTQDRWGREFAIDCAGEDSVVLSAGPDGVLGNDDDIR